MTHVCDSFEMTGRVGPSGWVTLATRHAASRLALKYLKLGKSPGDDAVSQSESSLHSERRLSCFHPHACAIYMLCFVCDN